MVDASTIKALFPEFESVENPRVELFINMAKLSVAETPWGTAYDAGVSYLTAHMLALSSRGSSGAAGPVTSEKVGELARSYGQLGAGSGDELLSTVYGAEYVRLRKLVLVSPMVTC